MAADSKREMLEKGLQRFRQEREYCKFVVDMLRQNPTDETELAVAVPQMMADTYDRIIRCAEEGKPFIGGCYCSAPEIYAAMDLPWYMLMSFPFLSISSPSTRDDIVQSERMGIAADLCTAIKLSIYYVETGMMPPPTAVIGMITPCDAVPMFHQIVARNKDWRDVPTFSCDAPYFEDERSVDYYAGELKRMVSFLEEHTGRRLDMDRLREVIEESNKQYELWAEYNELRRAVPCPHGWGLGGTQCWAVAQFFMVGDPRGTAWFRDMVAHAEQRVREGRGGVPNERIRLFWFDIRPPGWIFEFFPWLEEEWGVNIVMDMFAYAPYTLIDTSSEEAMFKGLAKRGMLDAPMIRQARGVADNFLTDIVRVVKDYKVDCVIYPGHMGHKDGSASIGLMREVCREIGVPFLTIGVDIFDQGYTSVDEIKRRVAEFFTTMGLG